MQQTRDISFGSDKMSYSNPVYIIKAIWNMHYLFTLLKVTILAFQKDGIYNEIQAALLPTGQLLITYGETGIHEVAEIHATVMIVCN